MYSGMAKAIMENGSELGMTTPATTTMTTMAHRRHEELLRGQHPGELQGDQEHRELEGEPEHGHQEHDEAEVLGRIEDLGGGSAAELPSQA